MIKYYCISKYPFLVHWFYPFLGIELHILEKFMGNGIQIGTEEDKHLA